MARKKIVNDKNGNPVELDQDAINAALAGAVTMADGSKPIEEKPNVPEEEKECFCGGKHEDEERIDSKCSDDIDLNLKKFQEDCHNLEIDAKKCKEQSSMHKDTSIDEYVRSINKKIYYETLKGGYSTNIQFRVTPQDWVNVNHIFDWYRSRGFQVDIKETTTAPYGNDVGTMNYNFTISWVDA